MVTPFLTLWGKFPNCFQQRLYHFASPPAVNESSFSSTTSATLAYWINKQFGRICIYYTLFVLLIVAICWGGVVCFAAINNQNLSRHTVPSLSLAFLYLFFFSDFRFPFFRFYLFRQGERGEKHQCVVVSCMLSWRPGPQPRHVPQTGN